MIHFVPSMLSMFLEELYIDKLSLLRCVITGGEKLITRLRKRFQETFSNTKLYLAYGPTEGSISVTHWNCGEDNYFQITPIGKPISNTKVYILDEGMRAVPIGAVGEIYIGGAGLARGYLNRPELTAEKFIENPFVSEADRAAGKNLRLYRTGDLGRYLPDGNIEFKGRMDDQVKIRGYRIELGEIESALNGCVGVEQSVVIARSVQLSRLPRQDGTVGTEGVDEGVNNPSSGSIDKRLIAYVVPSEDVRGRLEVQGSFKSSSGEMIEVLGGAAYGERVRQLREEIGKRLPEYMVPSYMVMIERIPLTSNGKVDRKSLPDPEVEVSLAGQYVAPRDEIEAKLCEIWAEVLGLERVGIHDNFFEIGGHSILILKIFFLIQKSFPQYITQVIDIFQNPTVEKLKLSLSLKNNSTIFSISEDTNINSPSIFLVHAGGGLALEYLSLKDHIKDKNIYCINSPYFGTQNTFSSIQDMALCYIKEIQKKYPNGPYILGGYSLGGLVAYEMAYQFSLQGIQIPKVLLIDTYYCSFQKIITLEKYLEDLENETIHIQDLNIKNELKKNGQLFYRYTPPDYKVNLILVKATRGLTSLKKYHTKSFDNNWSSLKKVVLKTHMINTKHEQLFRYPYFKKIANIISDAC